MSIKDLKKLLSKDDVVHFIGIGGIGMSALAPILAYSGFRVQGSDISVNQNVKRLKKMGINIFNGHYKANLVGVTVCVRSSIIKDDNVEIEHCKMNNIPVLHRSDILAELMRHKEKSISISGTHGKTTTTAIVASVIEEAGLEPTVINGGIINNKETNSYIGRGDIVIAEADESDNSFVKLPSDIAVITNIDSEHLDFYGSYDNLKKSFVRYIDQLPSDGFGVLCTDNDEVKTLIKKLDHKEIVTYGFEGKPDVKAVNIKQQGFGYSFDIVCSKKLKNHTINGLSTSIPGVHNVKNSLAAVAIALKLSVGDEAIIQGIKKYDGVKRRFTITGKKNGITFVDDYAHHPEEIIATLSAAKNILTSTGGKLFVIFQPHKYTRLRDLFDRFADSFSKADILYIADVYAASEKPLEGFNSTSLVDMIKQKDAKLDVGTLESSKILPDIIKKKCKKNDIVMFLGAGDITKWAYEVPSQIDG